MTLLAVLLLQLGLHAYHAGFHHQENFTLLQDPGTAQLLVHQDSCATCARLLHTYYYIPEDLSLAPVTSIHVVLPETPSPQPPQATAIPVWLRGPPTGC